MDLQAVSAMKAAYPQALVGVRFHEVLGCDSVWRSDGQKDCFQLALHVQPRGAPTEELQAEPAARGLAERRCARHS